MSICTPQLYAIIVNEIPHLKIIKLYKNLDYAFVHFPTREEAEVALQILNGKLLLTNGCFVLMMYNNYRESN